MQFIDLAAQQERIRDKIDANIQRVLSHGKYIMGPEVQELEQRLTEYVGVKHAIGCSSGTDALLLALMAYEVGPGDAILTTPFTFIATAEVIALLGATPVFVDIDAKTFNIDPVQLELVIKALIEGNSDLHPLPLTSDHRQPTSGAVPSTSDPRLSISGLKPRGIIAVDLFGLPADYDRIESIAKTHGLFAVEDAAQSFGAGYSARKACSFGDIACTSFFPAKPLGCYGDGGMCFTDDDGLAELLRSLLLHGKGAHKYDNTHIGVNGRLDTIQAAILQAKFSIFPEELQLRQQVAERYTGLLQGCDAIRVPLVPQDYVSVWAQYSLLAGDSDIRADIIAGLSEAGVPTAIYYPTPLHLQTAFRHLGYRKGEFPVAEDVSGRIFSLPMHPYIRAEEQREAIGALRELVTR